LICKYTFPKHVHVNFNCISLKNPHNKLCSKTKGVLKPLNQKNLVKWLQIVINCYIYGRQVNISCLNWWQQPKNNNITQETWHTWALLIWYDQPSTHIYHQQQQEKDLNALWNWHFQTIMEMTTNNKVLHKKDYTKKHSKQWCKKKCK
jgi:hypothetical protein